MLDPTFVLAYAAAQLPRHFDQEHFVAHVARVANVSPQDIQVRSYPANRFGVETRPFLADRVAAAAEWLTT
jgi:hypothetical protein